VRQLQQYCNSVIANGGHFPYVHIHAYIHPIVSSIILPRVGCHPAFLISFLFGSSGRDVLKRDFAKWARVVGYFQLCLLEWFFLGSNLTMWESKSIYVGCDLLAQNSSS
jgi:hypothetical protein